MEIADVVKDGYKNIEELLKDIGARGRFQWLLLATLLLFHLPGDIIYVDRKASLDIVRNPGS